MNLTLWIIAGLLALVFLASGAAKLILSKERLAALPGQGWAQDVGSGAVKAIGVLEVLAAAGLILPAALGVAPVLVPLAAVGLVALMIGAMVTHFRRNELTAIAGNLLYLALAGFVAWGRFGPESFV
ncbi:DoxX family protein [Streptosporangium sp. NPDC002524]|uniref:DoxX family protein n=1 Tax=Streptosporangium sp. NPDC002524 TaxID=3154537 RepID=UPI0033194692